VSRRRWGRPDRVTPGGHGSGRGWMLGACHLISGHGALVGGSGWKLVKVPWARTGRAGAAPPTAAPHLYTLSLPCTCMRIFRRSRGATALLDLRDPGPGRRSVGRVPRPRRRAAEGRPQDTAAQRGSPPRTCRRRHAATPGPGNARAPRRGSRGRPVPARARAQCAAGDRAATNARTPTPTPAERDPGAPLRALLWRRRPRERDGARSFVPKSHRTAACPRPATKKKVQNGPTYMTPAMVAFDHDGQRLRSIWGSK